jgi:MoaA/NifB/PqqE/SkfB family radical SAM enzyme
MYQRHTELFEKLDILNISIDGACRETYETLRRGGSYEKIIENLETFSDFASKNIDDPAHPENNSYLEIARQLKEKSKTYNPRFIEMPTLNI